MTNLNRRNEPMDEATKPTACLVCETLLPDAVDGLLSEAEQRAFDKHLASCTACAEELEEAQRGAAWLGMLKGHTPEPSASLLNKILAQTTGAEAAQAVAADLPVNVVTMPAMPVIAGTTSVSTSARLGDGLGGKLLAFRRKVVDIFSIETTQMHFHPRLAMTAAMAFFSVALTLNMTGVKLSNFHASNLRPSSLRRTVAETGSAAMRSFQNLRVVYQFESRLEDFRQSSNMDEDRNNYSAPAAPQKQEPGKQNNEQKDAIKPQGSSALEFPVVRQNVPRSEGV